jgi:L-threonylcarbamoyladenylate synthase
MRNEDVHAAAQVLIAGHLVAFATETVYGLGADATNSEAVAKIFAAKGRPKDHPLIVHVSSFEAALQWADEVPDYVGKLAENFWPGPMTLILKRSPLATDDITGGQDSVGVRVPSHPVAQELLAAFELLGGKGVVAPSANRFGKVSPTTSEAVRQELEQHLSAEDLILDGGQSSVGIESTIIDCTSAQPQILRLGAITASMISASTGLQLKSDESEIRVSGSLDSHYAPNAKLVLNQNAEVGDGLIALQSFQTPTGVIRLAEPATTEEYANQLYLALRKADDLGLSRVVAITPEGDELSEAINDRLMRASHKS